MGIIQEELKAAINSTTTLKSVTAVLKSGVPHTVYKGSLHVDEDGNLSFYDLLESSRINEALVYSIWFDKYITVNILTEDKKSYEIVGKPKKSITQGQLFEQVYKELKTKRDADLNAIWVIEPVEIREETFLVRKKQQEEEFPFLKHLDRAVK